MHEQDAQTVTGPSDDSLNSVLHAMGYFHHLHHQRTQQTEQQKQAETDDTDCSTISSHSMLQPIPQPSSPAQANEEECEAASGSCKAVRASVVLHISLTGALAAIVLASACASSFQSTSSQTGSPDGNEGTTMMKGFLFLASDVRSRDQVKETCMQTATEDMRSIVPAIRDACPPSDKGCNLLFVGGHHGTHSPDSSRACKNFMAGMFAELLGLHLLSTPPSPDKKEDIALHTATVYGQILYDRHPMLMFLQDMHTKKRNASSWPLGTFITSLQKACMQIRAQKVAGLSHLAAWNGKVLLELEDMLVPDKLCQEMLPGLPDDQTSEGDSKEQLLARSIMQGAAKATLGSMLR